MGCRINQTFNSYYLEMKQSIKKDKETREELLLRIRNIETKEEEAESKAIYWNNEMNKLRKQLERMYEKLALYDED